MPRARAFQSKRWCITLNNYTTQDLANFRASTTTPGSGIVYMVFQEEVGENNTKHIQAYCELERKQTMTRLKRTLGRRIHCEIARGSSKQASDYCKKEDTRRPGTSPVEVGERMRNKAEKLEELTEQIKDGKTMEHIAIDNSVLYVMHYKGLQALQDKTMPDRTDNPEVIINYGDSGAGKTYSTIKENPGAFIIPRRPSGGGKWFWNGYNYQKVCIIDDFRDNHFKLSDMMELINNTPFNVEIKGDHKKLQMTKLIINTNQAPEKWYRKIPNEDNGNGKTKKPLERRIKQFATIYDWTGCWMEDPDDITIQKRTEDFEFEPQEEETGEPQQYNFGYNNQ